MAEPLLAAIATDTGWFRFPSVDGNTFRDAGRLVDGGASPPALYGALYEQESFARLLLRGRILSGAERELDGRLIYAVAAAEDFAATGAVAADTDEVVNHLLRVAGVEAALVFQELGPGRTKASFRSKSAVNVREVAEQFGGGGHTMAAGATLSEPLTAARQKILDAMRNAMR
jgi:phosphoesterase RecJ-like protein